VQLQEGLLGGILGQAGIQRDQREAADETGAMSLHERVEVGRPGPFVVLRSRRSSFPCLYDLDLPRQIASTPLRCVHSMSKRLKGEVPLLWAGRHSAPFLRTKRHCYRGRGPQPHVHRPAPGSGGRSPPRARGRDDLSLTASKPAIRSSSRRHFRSRAFFPTAPWPGGRLASAGRALFLSSIPLVGASPGPRPRIQPASSLGGRFPSCHCHCCRCCCFRLGRIPQPRR